MPTEVVKTSQIAKNTTAEMLPAAAIAHSLKIAKVAKATKLTKISVIFSDADKRLAITPTMIANNSQSIAPSMMKCSA